MNGFSIILAWLTLIIGIPSFAQDSLSNSVFLEVGANSISTSVNYERLFKNKFIGRVGFFYINGDWETLAVPVAVGKIFGETKHYFEINFGATYYKDHGRRDNRVYPEHETVDLSGYVGYRLQSNNRRFLFRGGITYFHNLIDNRSYSGSRVPIVWPGVSFGYRF